MATHGRDDQEKEGAGQNPAFIRNCLTELQASQLEFPIKVEGTSTLPYASQIQSFAPDNSLILKLIRPLPHELASGALFEMVFSTGDQRYQGLITFKKREAYLKYRFSPPPALVLCDRRRNKRFPFRPREKVDVLAQDAVIPGHGMTGPLVNLSLGGLAFRVDRIMKLDDGLRIPVSTAFFDQGKALSLLRIRNLPRAPLLEGRGTIIHVEEISEGILLGVEFGELTAENTALLRQVIEVREKAFRTTQSPSPEPRPERVKHAPAESPGPAAPAAEENHPDTTLRQLQRRCSSLYLVGAAGNLMDPLRAAGFLRIESFASPVDLGQRPFAAPPARGVLVCALASARETLQELRAAQQSLGSWRALPAVYLSEDPDPLAGLAEEPSMRLLAMPENDACELVEALDQLAGVQD